MVFSDDDKVVLKNEYEEFGMNADLAKAPCQELTLFVSKAVIATLQRNENYGSQKSIRVPGDRGNGREPRIS